jgi:hypothetical protein
MWVGLGRQPSSSAGGLVEYSPILRVQSETRAWYCRCLACHGKLLPHWEAMPCLRCTWIRSVFVADCVPDFRS